MGYVSAGGTVEEVVIAVLITLTVFLPDSLRTNMRRLLPGIRILREAKGTPFVLRHTVGVACDGNTIRYPLLRRFFIRGNYALTKGKTTIGIDLMGDVGNTRSCTLRKCRGRTCALGISTGGVRVRTIAGVNIVHTARALVRLTRKYRGKGRAVTTMGVAR